MAGKRLILISDYTCPFCYLAHEGAARLQESDRIAVDGAAFELRPPGTPLPDADAAWMRDAWSRTVVPLLKESGLSMERPALMTRTRKAHEAAAYARTQDRYVEMHAALYEAYWRDGRDIGRIDVLVDIGREAGLDPSALRVSLDIDQFTDRVAQEEAWAAQLGLEGVPAYVLIDGVSGVEDGEGGGRGEGGGGTGVAAGIRVGLQPYEELESWVMQE